MHKEGEEMFYNGHVELLGFELQVTNPREEDMIQRYSYLLKPDSDFNRTGLRILLYDHDEEIRGMRKLVDLLKRSEVAGPLRNQVLIGEIHTMDLNYPAIIQYLNSPRISHQIRLDLITNNSDVKFAINENREGCTYLERVANMFRRILKSSYLEVHDCELPIYGSVIYKPTIFLYGQTDRIEI